jgi:hypothetical protein
MAGFIASMVACVVIFLITVGFSEYGCDSKAKMMGFKYDYGPIQGCMIKVESKWIPIESYRTLND